MGPIVFAIIFATLSSASCQVDINVSDYVFWKKEDIHQWDRFFPSRTLEQERLTIDAATDAINSLNTFLKDSLWKIVAFQTRELKTAKQLMEGTNGEGCIYGISNFLDKVIQEQQEVYQDCTADALSKIYRFKNNWSRLNATYQIAYQRALTGIDACAKTYPNKEAIGRLRSCVDYMNTNYFLAANNTQSSVFPSPSMSYFQNTVVKCASSAAQVVAAKGSQFLRMLVSCAALSDTVDPTDYAHDLSRWKGYNDTLEEQILKSQRDNLNQISTVENTVLNYYSLQKQALEQYVIESRGLNFYLNKVYSYLNDYYNTITGTSLDNPGDSGCAIAAKSALDAVANVGASTSLTCDQVIVNDTKRLIAEVNSNLLYVNNLTISIGNAAVLRCFTQGYMFAPNTIRECFLLSTLGFDIEYTDRYQSSSTNIQKLSQYLSTIFRNSDLPCGGTVLKRMFLGADKALYKLKRCLYSSSGTIYEVTTPVSVPP